MRAPLSVQEKLHILTLAMTLTWQEVPGDLNALGDITVYLDSKPAAPGGTRLRGIMETVPQFATYKETFLRKKLITLTSPGHSRNAAIASV